MAQEKSNIASQNAVPITGLYFNPHILIPDELADSLYKETMSTYFNERNNINQIMLFERGSAGFSSSGLPKYLQSLLETLAELLEPNLPAEVFKLLFPSEFTKARQAIINLYRPGEGISPHIDLLQRFDDGIIGVSLQSGCVMKFAKKESGQTHSLYLPPRSIIVLTGEARYIWTHGIDGVEYDFVKMPDKTEVCRLDRQMRLSITFRWLLPGADVVGEENP